MAPESHEAGDAVPAVPVALSSGEGEAAEVVTVKSVIDATQDQVKYCYDMEVESSPGLSGEVVVEWKVVDFGVQSATLVSNTTGSEALGACLVSRVSHWPFNGVKDQSVSWPFVFEAAD